MTLLPAFLPTALLSFFNYANGRVSTARGTMPLFLRSPSWLMTAKTRPAHCCQLQCGPLPPREERGEERRAPRSLQFCASTALREMITGNRRIRSRVSAINPRFRFFFFFFPLPPPSPLLSFLSFSPLLSPQPVNRRHRRLCANVFRNGEGRGESYACVIHCQDTIHDSAVALAFVRG